MQRKPADEEQIRITRRAMFVPANAFHVGCFKSALVRIIVLKNERCEAERKQCPMITTTSQRNEAEYI